MAEEIYAGPRERLLDGTRLLLEVDDTEIGVFEHGGQVFAYENRCVHQGGPACEGLIVGKIGRIIDEGGNDRGSSESETEMRIACPWHGWEFDLATGRSVAYPQTGLKRFDVVERDGDVYVLL